jgi:outer membrane protein assembly complex protein YaeT
MGIEPRVSGLRYNLFLLRAELGGLELAAAGAPGEPFFTAARVTVDISWSAVLRGAVSLQSLQLFSPRVSVYRRADGSFNLPEFPTGDPGAPVSPAGPFIVGRFLIEDLEATYVDESRGISAELGGFSLDLQPQLVGSTASGRFSADGGLTVRVGDDTTSTQQLDGGLAFDGATLAIDDLALEVPEGRILGRGRIGMLTAQPDVDLTFDGDVDLEQAARWVSVDPTPSGRVSFTGLVSGSRDDPRLSLQLSSDDLAWHGLENVSLRLSGSGSSSGVVLETLALNGAGGSVDGTAAVIFGEDAAFQSGQASLEWRTLDPTVLHAAFAGEPRVRLATRLDGSLNATLIGNDLDALTANVRVVSHEAASSAGVPVSGRAELSVNDGAWTLTHDHRVGSIHLTGTGRGLVDTDAPMSSTLGGQVSIAAAELSRAVRDAGRAGIELPTGVAETLGGRMTASGGLGGTLGAPIADITLNVVDLTAGGIGPALLTAQGSLTAARGILTTFELAAGPNRAQGSASVGWGDGKLDGQAVVDAPDLNQLLADVPAEWRPDGSMSIAVTMTGTTSEPRTSGTVEGDRITVAGQQIDHVSSAFGSTGTVIMLDDLTLTQADGYLSARGRYDLSSRRYSVQADGEDWEVRPIPGAPVAASEEVQGADNEPGVPVAGTIDVRLEGEGTIGAPAGHGELTFVDLRYGDYPVGAGRMEIVVAERQASVKALLSDLLTSLHGTVGLAAPYPFSGALDVDQAELSRLGGAVPVEGSAGQTLASALTGTLALSAEVAGDLDQLGDASADVQIELVDAAIDGTPIALDRPARLQYRREHLVAEDVDVRIGESRFELAGRLGAEAPVGGLRLSIDGRLEDVLAVARVVAPDADLSGGGSIAVRVTASGSLMAPSVSAQISTAIDSLTSGDLPPVTDLVVNADYRDGLLRLARADATWQGASITASGDVPAGLFADYLPAAHLKTLPPALAPARLSARIESVTREVLAPFLEEAALARIDAQASGSLELTATGLEPASITGHFELDRADFVLAGVPLRQLEPTAFTLTDGDLRVDAFRWGGEGNELVLTGLVALGSDPADLDLDLRGVLDLRMLRAFVPDLATGGTARVTLAARGTTAEPDVNGAIALEGVSVNIREPRVAITDLAGTIHVTRDRATASAISGSANGGTVSLAGFVSFPGLALGDGSLTLEGRRLAVELASGAQAEADADLTLALSASDDPLLSGRVTVLRGAYREPISFTDLAFGDDSSGVETAGLEEEGFADRIRLDIALVTADDVRVDNNYGRAELGANVRVLGTIGRPALGGRATIGEGGQVFLGGNTYIIEQGTIDFADPTRIAPDLNLRASTRIGGYGITLAVSGAPDALEHDLQSDPPLAESDIVSLLVTGRTLSEAGSAQTEVARDQVLGYLSGDLLGFAGRAVGLDTVRFERGLSADTLPTDLALFAGDEDPASRLTISKNVRRDVEIVLSQNLRESGGVTWIAMYRPLLPVELRTISRDDNSRAYEFRHTLQFGGGVRSRGTAASGARRPAPRVADVRFAGDPGFDADRLRSALDLDPGDRFDFFTWQRDREALEWFYHARDYLEARVAAAREPPGESAEPVTLVYTIERGPQTRLSVEGHSLPGGLLDRLREAWGEAVFDGFLLDDIRELVRRHLMTEGYLQPVIEPEVVQPGADEKQIVVRVQAGARSTGRTIDFAGNEAMPADRLMAALEPLEIEEVAWTDPEIVATGLERFYRSEGFLVADVTVESPVFKGSRARLPVTIKEGPRFVLARVAIEGASALDEATARTIADLPEGVTYSATEADAARRRVERAYRERGFNGVRTIATANVDVPGAAVTLTLAITEGSRQVLADIAISGANVTRPEVVTDNLQLEMGEAVDLTAWYQARRRLYDTNVFRSVELEVEPIVEAPAAAGDEPVRARVTLEEWPRYRFRYGFQLNDEVSPVAERARELSPGLVADFQDRNLLGRASSGGLAIRLQDDFRIARAFLGTPTFFGLKIRSGVFFTRARQDFNQEGVTPFIEDTTGVSFEQRLRPLPPVEVAYSYRIENKRTFNPDPNPFDPFPLDLRVRIGRFAGSFVSERRDDPFDATRGWFHSSTLEYSPEFFGSDLRFVKYLGQAYYFRPIGPGDRPTVFASAARIGVGRGFGQDLIVSEKFFVGGANSVRGYPEDSIGELDFFGDPRGGNALVLFNQEVRFPVFKWVRGVAFADAGSVFPQASDLSLTDLQAGVGLGLRIRTPFALVRIDHATALSPRTGEASNRWYFSIGQAF